MIPTVYMSTFGQKTIFHHPSLHPDEVYNCPVREGRRQSRVNARLNTAIALKGGLLPLLGLFRK
jgi:hypothetical protein